MFQVYIKQGKDQNLINISKQFNEIKGFWTDFISTEKILTVEELNNKLQTVFDNLMFSNKKIVPNRAFIRLKDSVELVNLIRTKMDLKMLSNLKQGEKECLPYLKKLSKPLGKYISLSLIVGSKSVYYHIVEGENNCWIRLIFTIEKPIEPSVVLEKNDQDANFKNTMDMNIHYESVNRKDINNKIQELLFEEVQNG